MDRVGWSQRWKRKEERSYHDRPSLELNTNCQAQTWSSLIQRLYLNQRFLRVLAQEMSDTQHTHEYEKRGIFARL